MNSLLGLKVPQGVSVVFIPLMAVEVTSYCSFIFTPYSPYSSVSKAAAPFDIKISVYFTVHNSLPQKTVHVGDDT